MRFESEGSRWLCKSFYARTQIILYVHVGKKKKNLFFTLWYKGAILLAEMCGVGVRKMADKKMM
jgi:hypothetical protein